MPRVCAPSESSTIVPGIFPSLLRGALPTPAFTTCTATPSASPIAVPDSGERRLIPSSSWLRSVVGITSTSGPVENETSASLTCFGIFSANVVIADCAAPRRDGLTSFARIDPETSTSSTTVAWFDGSLTVTCGRATAADADATASRKRSSGTSGSRRRRRVATTDASTSRFVNATA